ncbi:MAG: NTPase KAP [Leptolyngbya sp. SIO1D8]|nr:NTPase KAP [Leptolyngbya sp. SIO1D8]
MVSSTVDYFVESGMLPTLTAIEKICGVPSDQSQTHRLMNNFYDVVTPYITTPRHVARFQNAISVTWPAIANDVCIADFIALETLRLYEPMLFQAIRKNKRTVCGLDQREDTDRHGDVRFTNLLIGVDGKRHETAKLALQRLFPRLERVYYTHGKFLTEWNAERRICVEKHFDTYFQFSLSEDALSVKKIEELIASAGNRDFVQSTMREAAKVTRQNGSSMVPVYLDALMAHASKIDKQQVKPLIKTLFEIHDDIDLECDANYVETIANTTFRFHWLIQRLTSDRFTLDECTDIYLDAIRKASLGWTVDFAESVQSSYQEDRTEPKQKESYLITKTALPKFVSDALDKIRCAAKDGSLLQHNDLLYILYRWRDLKNNDPTEVRTWTDSLMNDQQALVILARQFVVRSSSYNLGFSGLPDRVFRSVIRSTIKDDIDILDAQVFRTKLETIRDAGKLDEDSVEIVTTQYCKMARRSTLCRQTL